MSDTNLSKLTELSIEKRREYQLQVMRQWDSGKITGRTCIEEILGLEKMIFLNGNTLKELRNKYGEESEQNPTKA